MSKKSEEYLLRRIYLNIGIFEADKHIAIVKLYAEVMIRTCTTTVETCRKSWQMPSWDMCKKCWKAFPTWIVANDSNVALAFFFCEVVGVLFVCWEGGSFKWGWGGELICAFQLLIRFKLSKKESFKTPTKFIRGVLAISKVAIVGLHLHECLQAPHEIEMKLFAPFTRST